MSPEDLPEDYSEAAIADRKARIARGEVVRWVCARCGTTYHSTPDHRLCLEPDCVRKRGAMFLARIKELNENLDAERARSAELQRQLDIITGQRLPPVGPSPGLSF